MASAWQWASAPARPPRSPPLPGLTLLTKNDISAFCACAAVVRSSVADAIAIKDSDAILNILNVLPFRVAMATFQSTRSITNAITCMIAHKRLCHYGNTGSHYSMSGLWHKAADRCDAVIRSQTEQIGHSERVR